MIRPILAAALLFAFAAGAKANTPSDVPKHKCEPKPQVSGPRMMQEPGVAKKLQRDVDIYKACMKAYADERAASAKAHSDAGNAAIDEYNETMKALLDAQAQR
jgi:hypothetical protein